MLSGSVDISTMADKQRRSVWLNVHSKAFLRDGLLICAEWKRSCYLKDGPRDSVMLVEFFMYAGSMPAHRMKVRARRCSTNS